MSRRAILVLAVLFICAGAFTLTGGASVTTKQALVQLGDVRVTADEHRPIPPWVGGVAVGLGVVMLVAGARRQP